MQGVQSRGDVQGAREGIRRRCEVNSREVVQGVQSRGDVQGRERGGGLTSTPERSCRGPVQRGRTAVREGRRSEVHSREVAREGSCPERGHHEVMSGRSYNMTQE